MNAETLASADYWDALAEDQLRRAEWDDVHVGSGVPARHRAATYRATAKALRLESSTGMPHCACCLKPLGRKQS